MSNNGGDGLNASQLGSTPTALAHDEFIASFWLPRNRRRQRPDDNGLKNSDFANRSGQFLKLFFVEYVSRLSRIRDYLVEGELRIGGAGNFNESFVRFVLFVLSATRAFRQNVVAAVSLCDGVIGFSLAVVLHVAVKHSAAAALGVTTITFDKADILHGIGNTAVTGLRLVTGLCSVTGLRLVTDP